MSRTKIKNMQGLQLTKEEALKASKVDNFPIGQFSAHVVGEAILNAWHNHWISN